MPRQRFADRIDGSTMFERSACFRPDWITPEITPRAPSRNASIASSITILIAEASMRAGLEVLSCGADSSVPLRAY